MDPVKILLIVTSHAVISASGEPTGVWFEELSTPYYAFSDAGYDVTVASVAGGEVPIDPRSRSNPEDMAESVKRFMQDDRAMAMIADTPSVTGINASDYNAVFFPGGHGTMWDFPDNPQLAGIITTFLENDRPVAAVCHGPAVFVGVTDSSGEPVVKGRKISAFTNEEEEAVGLTGIVPFLLETRLKELGAEFVKADNFQPMAIADGNIMTGQNPASSKKLAQMVIDAVEKKRNISKKAVGQ